MINLEFEVSKYSLLVNTIIKNKQIKDKIKKRPELLEYYERTGGVNYGLDNLLDNIDSRVFDVLSSEELRKGETFFQIIEKCYNPLNDENFDAKLDETFENCKTKLEEKSIFSKDIDDIKEVMKGLVNTKEFQTIYDETVQYKDKIKASWDEKSSDINKFVSEVTGISVDDKPINVLVMSPRFETGYGGIKNLILFSNNALDSKSADRELTYLTHESLHARVLPYLDNMDDKDVDNLHGLIHFIADKELYYRLSGKNYSSEDMPVSEYLTGGMKKMYPYWLGYMYRNSKNPVADIENHMKNNPELNFYINNNPRYSAKAIASFFADKSNLSPYDFIKLDFEQEIFNNANHLYNSAIDATKNIAANDIKYQQDKLNSLQRENQTNTRENGKIEDIHK